MNDPNGTALAMTRQGMKEFLDAFNRHDVAAIMAFMADDAVYETPSGAEAHGKRVEGKEAIAAYVEAFEMDGLPVPAAKLDAVLIAI